MAICVHFWGQRLRSWNVQRWSGTEGSLILGMGRRVGRWPRWVVGAHIREYPRYIVHFNALNFNMEYIEYQFVFVL